MQNNYFKNLNSLIKLQRKIKSFLRIKKIKNNQKFLRERDRDSLLEKEKNIDVNVKGFHKPNKSSFRFKQNRLSITNLNSNELAINSNTIGTIDNTNYINSNSNKNNFSLNLNFKLSF